MREYGSKNENGSMSASGRIYFAPMEGITGYLFRRTHAEVFGGADAYYTPFLSANHTFSFQEKELRDTDPENNRGLTLIPQVLTADAEQFLWALRTLREMGYRCVDFNCGCPSGTVCAKGKGAGMLRDPDGLRRFLDTVFRDPVTEETEISVKTRIGYHEKDIPFCEKLMEIYNEFPLRRLIIHPRVRDAVYRGSPDMEGFGQMYSLRKMPVVYNGDILTTGDYDRIVTEYPDLEGIMIGRGLIRDPALARKIRGGPAASKAEWERFHDLLFDRYLSVFRQEKTAVGAMKELWYFWKLDHPDQKNQVKTIMKATSAAEYRIQARICLADMFIM